MEASYGENGAGISRVKGGKVSRNVREREERTKAMDGRKAVNRYSASNLPLSCIIALETEGFPATTLR